LSFDSETKDHYFDLKHASAAMNLLLILTF